MNVHSIFESISGESGFFPQGTWCTFLRFQGCNLRCRYCDTKDAQDASKTVLELSIAEIVAEVEGFKNKHVLITGGEPLMQGKILGVLIAALVEKGYLVQIETNGHLAPVYPPSLHVRWIVDYKGPSSGELRSMPSVSEIIRMWMNQCYMMKFVVNPDLSTGDLQMAVVIMHTMLRLGYKERFLVSPMNADGNSIPKIVDYLKASDQDLLDRIVFSVQLHKLLQLP